MLSRKFSRSFFSQTCRLHTKSQTRTRLPHLTLLCLPWATDLLWTTPLCSPLTPIPIINHASANLLPPTLSSYSPRQTTALHPRRPPRRHPEKQDSSTSRRRMCQNNKHLKKCLQADPVPVPGQGGEHNPPLRERRGCVEQPLERLRDPSHGCVSTKDVYLALVSDHVLEFISPHANFVWHGRNRNQEVQSSLTQKNMLHTTLHRTIKWS